jgi:hypothetical protein
MDSGKIISLEKRWFSGIFRKHTRAAVSDIKAGKTPLFTINTPIKLFVNLFQGIHKMEIKCALDRRFAQIQCVDISL